MTSLVFSVFYASFVQFTVSFTHPLRFNRNLTKKKTSNELVCTYIYANNDDDDDADDDDNVDEFDEVDRMNTNK